MAATKWPHLSLFSVVSPVPPLLLPTPAPLGQRTSCQELVARAVTVSVAVDIGCPCAPSPGLRASATTFIGHRPLSGGRRGRFSPRTPASYSPFRRINPPLCSGQTAILEGGPLFVRGFRGGGYCFRPPLPAKHPKA